jgi:hypothetical protein
MEIKDLECVDSTFSISFPTDATLTATSTGTGIQTSETNTPGSISSSCGRPNVSFDRYLQGTFPDDDSFELRQQMQLQVCPYKIGNLRIIKTKVPFAKSNLACFREGYRAGDITKANIKDALALAESCLGLGQSMWIGRYWNPVRKGSCLELSVGRKSRTGGISLMTDCSIAQSVLCEDPFFKP